MMVDIRLSVVKGAKSIRSSNSDSRLMRSSNYSDRSMSSPSCRVTGFSGSHAISQLRKDVRQCCSFYMEREQQCMPERICPLRQHECSCLTDPAGLRYARADPAPESRLRDTRCW